MAADAARALAQRRASVRSSGVAWSGLAPDALPPRAADEVARDAEDRLAALQRWRQSRGGRLLSAMAQAERAVEAVRACVARGLAANDARCGLALRGLEAAASAALTALDAGMDAAASGGLSERRCATNIASGSRSTGSSTSSAG